MAPRAVTRLTGVVRKWKGTGLVAVGVIALWMLLGGSGIADLASTQSLDGTVRERGHLGLCSLADS
jgi:hypothetical protein